MSAQPDRGIHATPIKAERLPSQGRFAALAARGFSVIPIRHPDRDPDTPAGKRGKKPPEGLLWKHYQTEHPSPGLVASWEANEQNYNVAVVTGSVSGKVVLDIDSDATLVELADRGYTLPRTPTVRTGRCRHIYFDHPGLVVGNGTSLGGIAGLDFRGEGGYAIGPGSMHENGTLYAWEISPDDADFAPMPDWLLDLLRSPKPPIDLHPGGNGKRPPVAAAGQGNPYGRAALEREAETLRKTSTGSRNDQLNRSAFSMAQLVAGGVLGMHETEQTLRSACEQNGLLSDDGEAAFKRSFDSGFKAGMARPRAPERRIQRERDHSGPPISHEAQNTIIHAPFSDLGNAERLKALFGHRIRYCFERGWFVWNDSVWEQDLGPLVPALASQTARRTLRAAADLDNEESRKALTKHALRFESASRITGAVTLARGFQDLQVKAAFLDADPWVLNTPTGIVDLRTGNLLPHDPNRLCTKITRAPYQADAICPRWEEFLLQVFQDDVELVFFIQRAFGIALTGDTSEQVLFFLWGSGANGKTVLLETLRFVLGSYAQAAPMSLWLSDRDERANAATPDLAALKGARFVTSIESNAQRRLNEGLIKGVTGGDLVPARELYGRPFNFNFEGKLFCASNHRPVVKGTDEGIWRRFVLIPFTRTFRPEERDRNLPGKLRAEATGILRWGVDGCLAWQRDGLNPPPSVRAAVHDYREEQDRLGAWISERCILDPRLSAPVSELFEDFTQWAKENHEEVLTSDAFCKALGGRFPSHRTKLARMRRGLGLASQATQPDLTPEPGDG